MTTHSPEDIPPGYSESLRTALTKEIDEASQTTYLTQSVTAGIENAAGAPDDLEQNTIVESGYLDSLYRLASVLAELAAFMVNQRSKLLHLNSQHISKYSQFDLAMRYSRLTLEIKAMQADVRDIGVLLTPLCSNNLIGSHARLCFDIAYTNLAATIRRDILTCLIDAVQDRSKDWWSTQTLLHKRIKKRWDKLVEVLIGSRNPQKKVGLVEAKRTQYTESRLPSPLRKLDQKAQAAVINLVDGEVMILVAMVIDPESGGLTVSKRFLSSLSRQKGSQSCTAALRKTDVRLQQKIGWCCKGCAP